MKLSITYPNIITKFKFNQSIEPPNTKPYQATHNIISNIPKHHNIFEE